MVHRIECHENSVPDIYFKRNLAIKKDELIDFISNLLSEGLKVGSVKNTIDNSDYFHLSFDDGFKEHLEIAQELKEIFGFKDDTMTFAINVGNSITFNYTGMDVLYEAIGKNGESALGQCFGLDFTNAEDDIIGKLKERIIAISPDEFSQIRNCLRLETKRLSALFLNSSEIRELAQLATIASHGMTHRDLTNHPEISQQEIRQSKRILEELVGREIQIFSYPEGRCNPQIQQFCKDAGYVYSLSISHQQDNPYCIGRFCITNHRKEIMRRLHE